MAWDQLNYSFKALINKRETDNAKLYLNEKGDFTINVHASEIWLDSIPSTPPSSATSVVQPYTLLAMLNDTSVGGGMSYFATTNTDAILGQNDEASRINDWISDKFGSAYNVQIYDGSNNLLSVADPSSYLFAYQTGILTFQNTSTAYGPVATTGPFKVTGYRYIGRKGVGGVESVGGISGIVTDQSGGAAITSTGNLMIDQSFSPTWTGTQTFQGPIISTNNLTFTPVSGDFGLRLANIGSLPTPSSGNVGALVWDTTSGGSVKVSTGSAWVLLATTSPGATNVTGYGTTNTVPLWDNTTGLLGDSIITQPDPSTIVVGGRITATTKSFSIPHPTKPGMMLVYGCLEGPEHSVYHRGIAGGDGPVRVELPEYWSVLVGRNYTVSLGSYCKHEVRVVAWDENGFWVARCGNRKRRKKAIEFSYCAIGGRADAPLVCEVPIREEKRSNTPLNGIKIADKSVRIGNDRPQN